MVRVFESNDSEGVKNLILSILSNEYPFDRNAYADTDIYDISGTYSGNRNAFFVYSEGEHVIGTIAIKEDSIGTALLRRFFVSPDHRGKGIGTELLKRSISFCMGNGYSNIVFRATDRMKDAIRLMKNNGFKERERLEVSGFHIHMYALTI